MASAADTLVAQFPTASAQLRGPVLSYLRQYAPFPSEQSLYLAVFYPDGRGWSESTEFPAKVRRVNPGIVTVGDYIRKARAAGGRVPRPSGETGRAFSEVAGLLGVPLPWLHNLIALESGWSATATNKYTGARGLIQFMPRTAAGMGFVAGGLAVLVLVGVLAWWLSRTA